MKQAGLERKPDTITFVWMQGERDAEDEQHEVYAESLKGLIKQLNCDLNCNDVNVVIGRLSNARCGVKTKNPT